MINLLLDGFAVFLAYWEAVLAILAASLGVGLLVLRQIRPKEGDYTLLVSVGFGLGSVFLSLLSYAIIAVSYFANWSLPYAAFLLLAVALILLVYELRKVRPGDIKWGPLFAAALVVFGLLILRLTFLRDVLVPPHSDSPVHYQIISDLLLPRSGDEAGVSLSGILEHYYHFGFHSLAAWLVSISKIPMESAISLLGQIFIAIAPISIFALAYSVTRNLTAAGFAALLAAFGWVMPAFAVNWGKFPALSALAVAPAAIAAVIGLDANGLRKPKTILWFAVLALSLAVLHSRIVVLLLFALLVYVLVRKIDLSEDLSLLQSVRLSILGAVALLPLFSLLKDFYGSLSILGALLALLPFAFRSYPKPTVGAIAFSFLLWLGLAVKFRFAGKAETLLDEQFVAMTLFIPLSLIAALGFSALTRSTPFKEKTQWIPLGLAAALVAFNFHASYFHPDPCCTYYGPDDQRAFEWIRDNTSPDALFLIAAAKSEFQMIGTDAGIWIDPLTQRPTNKVAYDTGFYSVDEFERICRIGAKELYIYSGGRAFSFRMKVEDQRIPQVFGSGSTGIFQVAGCERP